MDLESVPGGMEEGVRARHAVQYDRTKMIDGEEVRQGAGMDKEWERIYPAQIWPYVKPECVVISRSTRPARDNPLCFGKVSQYERNEGTVRGEVKTVRVHEGPLAPAS